MTTGTIIKGNDGKDYDVRPHPTMKGAFEIRRDGADLGSFEISPAGQVRFVGYHTMSGIEADVLRAVAQAFARRPK
jgi:hypothetical protein